MRNHQRVLAESFSNDVQIPNARWGFINVGLSLMFSIREWQIRRQNSKFI